MLVDMHGIDYVFRDNHSQSIHVNSVRCALFIYVPLDEYRRAARENRAISTFSYHVSGPGVIVMSEADVNEEYLTQLDQAKSRIYPYMCCYVEVRMDGLKII